MSHTSNINYNSMNFLFLNLVIIISFHNILMYLWQFLIKVKLVVVSLYSLYHTLASKMSQLKYRIFWVMAAFLFDFHPPTSHLKYQIVHWNSSLQLAVVFSRWPIDPFIGWKQFFAFPVKLNYATFEARVQYQNAKFLVAIGIQKFLISSKM